MSNTKLLEVFHIAEEYLNVMDQYPGEPRRVAAAIRHAQNNPDFEVKFLPDSGFGENLPEVSKDHQILVGGGIWDLCIPRRIKSLRESGYTNVTGASAFSLGAPKNDF